jgi:hypothetical protein
MSDSYTETTRKSWVSRIRESMMGVLIGLVLIVVSAIGLFWNEGRAVQTAKSLAEGAGLVVEVDSARLDPTNEGKLVHVSGEMKAGVPPRDAEFGVSADGLHLVRTVEMYQWEETRTTETRKTDGSEYVVTTPTYARAWSETPIDSHQFMQPHDHANPDMRYRGAMFPAHDLTLGAFRPSEAIVNELPASQQVRVDETPRELEGRAVDGVLYLGADPAQPRIGDLRVSYRLAPAGPVSIVGRQTSADLTPYQTKAGDRLLMVRTGTMSAVDMFEAAEEAAVILAWGLRLLGALVMFLGFWLILKPLVVVADVVPLIGNVLGAGAELVSLIATAILAPLVIAVAWLWYRPLVSIIVIAVGLTAAFGFRTWAARKAAAAAQPAPAR